MLICTTKQELHIYCRQQAAKSVLIGFVPTMGALHQGHLSLVKASQKQCSITICSIFINPTQFNNSKDYKKYPITTEEDIELLKEIGVDVLFLPNVKEIYPNGTTTLEMYDLGKLENLLEGHYRPGHFQGVCQVVHRLLNVVNPDMLFLGQKDYQQCMVLKKLVTLIQKNIQVFIITTEREKSGLAMSSRNKRLSAKALEQASTIYKAMVNIKEKLHQQSFEILETSAKIFLLQNGFSHIDYVVIADAETLEPLSKANQGQNLIILVAAFIEEIRLIDNLPITF